MLFLAVYKRKRPLIYSCSSRVNVTFVKDFNWGLRVGLPLQIMILRKRPLIYSCSSRVNATFVKDFNWGLRVGLPLQIMILCRGNPLWLPLT